MAIGDETEEARIPMNTGVTQEQRSAVRKALEELSLCETGYTGTLPCRTCALGYECADAVEHALTRSSPGTSWAPAIREVLGLW